MCQIQSLSILSFAFPSFAFYLMLLGLHMEVHGFSAFVINAFCPHEITYLPFIAIPLNSTLRGAAPAEGRQPLILGPGDSSKEALRGHHGFGSEVVGWGKKGR